MKERITNLLSKGFHHRSIENEEDLFISSYNSWMPNALKDNNNSKKNAGIVFLLAGILIICGLLYATIRIEPKSQFKTSQKEIKIK